MLDTMKTTASKSRKLLMIIVLTVVMVGTTALPVSEVSAAGTTNTTTTTATKEIPITGVSFPANINLKVGEAKTFSIQTTPSNTTYLTNIQWSYQLDSGFDVITNGTGTYWNRPSSETIIGKAPGTGLITNTIEVYDSTKKYIKTYKVKAKVTVTANTTTTKPTQTTTKSIPLQSISLSKSSLTLNPGKTATLGVTYYPSNTTSSKTVSWSSGNTSVAKVSSGKITAVKAGTTTIYASCNGKTSKCTVTVKSAESYKNVSEAYTLLNQFRTTKSNQWYWKSDNKTKQKVTGLKSLKKDAELEKVAKLRAKEQWTMYYSRGQATHTRPNGKAWSTAYPKNMSYKAENLAWGYSTCKSVITSANGWAETNEKYSGQGHRRNMLSTKATKVGIACYEKDGKTCWAMCLGK